MSAPLSGIPVPEEIATLRNTADPTAVRAEIQVIPDEIRTLWRDGQVPVPAVPPLKAPVNGFTETELKEPINGFDNTGPDPVVDPLDVYVPKLAVVPHPLVREAKASTAQPSEAENHTVAKVVVGVLAAVIAVRALSAWEEEAKEWERRGRFDSGRFSRRIGKTFTDTLTEPLAASLSGLLLGGRGSVGDSLGVAYSQEQAAPLASRWSRSYAGKVAGDYAASSTEALARSVEEWVAVRLPAPAMAARARDLYGLDPRAAHAIARYTESKGKGRTGLIERYLEKRAHANATVWSMSAQNAGREMLFTELIEAGLLPHETRKVWLTADDERTCPVCKPMNEISVPFGGRFHVGGSHLMTPPVHPNCRCTITVDTHPEEGFVFPKDYHMIHGWLRSSTRSLFR